jgi:hypothetical protein
MLWNNVDQNSRLRLTDCEKLKPLKEDKPNQLRQLKPGSVADKHGGLWTRRREFESPPGYQTFNKISILRYDLCAKLQRNLQVVPVALNETL